MLDLDGSSLTQEENKLLLNPHVGGVILFARNISSRGQVQELCSEIRKINPKLLIAVDQEGGRVQRLKEGYTILPTMQKLAAFLNSDNDKNFLLATDLGWLMASEVIASGLDISFAPVLDLDDSRSSVIGDRSMGDNPDQVIAIASAFIKGMNQAGMQATGKHFPGHGGIFADSHLTFSQDVRSLSGAIFEDVGQWKRPWYFPLSKSEKMHDAVQRESKTVRKSAGILDGSTLGKIEIKGKDALKFMNLIYTNSFTKMKPGSSRYALMLGEDGMVKDDGIICKISDEHFIATTTTGGAANVLACMEEYAQTEWPNLNVYMNSITEQFATFNISGPKTRDIMSKVFSEINFSNEAFPFMTFQFHDFQNTQIRIMRASFTGEMGYEIYVPSNKAIKIWEQIHDIGKEFGLIPYGTETMHLLRAEKGYILVGQDTDGSITPIDLGLNWMIGKTKTDFLGKRSLSRSDTVRPDRKQLVGILPSNKEDAIQEGQHIILNESIQTPMPMLGHITSSYHSPTMGHSFGLAVIKDGHSLIGTKAFASTPDQKTIPVEIVKPIFYDEKNERLVS